MAFATSDVVKLRDALSPVVSRLTGVSTALPCDARSAEYRRRSLLRCFRELGPDAPARTTLLLGLTVPQHAHLSTLAVASYLGPKRSRYQVVAKGAYEVVGSVSTEPDYNRFKEEVLHKAFQQDFPSMAHRFSGLGASYADLVNSGKSSWASVGDLFCAICSSDGEWRVACSETVRAVVRDGVRLHVCVEYTDGAFVQHDRLTDRRVPMVDIWNYEPPPEPDSARILTLGTAGAEER
jgi:hypothetical protein